MQLITAWSHVNLAIFPIGDNFTMDYIDAEKAADFVDVNVIIGVHYDTFDYIKIDKQAAIDHFSSRGKTLLLPAIGETIEV